MKGAETLPFLGYVGNIRRNGDMSHLFHLDMYGPGYGHLLDVAAYGHYQIYGHFFQVSHVVVYAATAANYYTMFLAPMYGQPWL